MVYKEIPNNNALGAGWILPCLFPLPFSLVSTHPQRTFFRTPCYLWSSSCRGDLNFNYNLLHGIRDKPLYLNYCYLEQFSQLLSLDFPVFPKPFFTFSASVFSTFVLPLHHSLHRTQPSLHFLPQVSFTTFNIDIIFKPTSSTKKRQNGSHGKD